MEELYAIQYLENDKWVTCDTEDAQAKIFFNKNDAQEALYEWKTETGDEDSYRMVKVSLNIVEVSYDA